MVCPKCKSVRWLDDEIPAKTLPISKQEGDDLPIRTGNDLPIGKTPIKAVVLAEVDIPTAEFHEPEPQDEWAGWSDEQEEHDGTSGETIVYRRQLVRPFRTQEIRREH